MITVDVPGKFSLTINTTRYRQPKHLKEGIMNRDQIARIAQQEIDIHNNLTDDSIMSKDWRDGFLAGLGHLGKVLMRRAVVDKNKEEKPPAGQQGAAPMTDSIADKIAVLVKIMEENRRIKELSYVDHKCGVIRVVQETKMCS